MTIAHSLRIACALSILILGCQREAPPAPVAPKTQTTAPAATGTPQNMANAKVSTVVPANAVEGLADSHLGSTLGADGRVAADKDSFKEGEPIYVTMTVRDAPKGLSVSAHWFESGKDKEIALESRPLSTGEKTTTFSWASKKKLKAGKYRVVTYWGGNVAGEHDFTVTK